MLRILLICHTVLQSHIQLFFFTLFTKIRLSTRFTYILSLVIWKKRTFSLLLWTLWLSILIKDMMKDSDRLTLKQVKEHSKVNQVPFQSFPHIYVKRLQLTPLKTPFLRVIIPSFRTLCQAFKSFTWK
jgi:hypothetical protein